MYNFVVYKIEKWDGATEYHAFSESVMDLIAGSIDIFMGWPSGTIYSREIIAGDSKEAIEKAQETTVPFLWTKCYERREASTPAV